MNAPARAATPARSNTGNSIKTSRGDLSQGIARHIAAVIDTVLRNEESATQLSDQLSGAGYKGTLVDVEVPFEVAETQIRTRW